MNWALVDKNGIVNSVIVYNGTDPYTPVASYLTLQQVNNWVQMAQSMDVPKPKPTPVPTQTPKPQPTPAPTPKPTIQPQPIQTVIAS